jgi:hypothetical protein
MGAVGDLSLDESEGFAALFVDPEETRGAIEASVLEVSKDPVDEWRVWAERSSDGVPDAHDTLGDIAAGEGDLSFAHASSY